MNHLKIISILSVFLLSACNNNRTNYLSAANTCSPETDIAAYSLNADEKELWEEASLPGDEKIYQVTKFKTTVVLEGDKEEKVTFSFVYDGGVTLDDKPVVVSSCLSGLKPETKIEPFSVEIPLGAVAGSDTLRLIKVNIDIGHPVKEDQSDFLKIESEFIEKDIVADPAVPTDPVDPNPADPSKKNIEIKNLSTSISTYLSYYSPDSNESTVYQLIKPKKDAEPQYFVHHQNSTRKGSLVSSSTRITLSFKEDTPK